MSTATTDPDTTTTGPTDDVVRDTVVEWFRALDRHDDVADLLPYLVDEGFELRFPQETKRGRTGFRDWYDVVTHRFFDEEHRVTHVGIERADHVTTVTVLVNWQARVWTPPAPYSTWVGFDATQTWYLVLAPDGRPLVQSYVVESLDPMPGSPDL